MSKILGDNLLYRGQQPNFERDQFKTLAQMRAYNKAWLDDGHIAFCLEDKQHYAWNATANEWQLFTPSGVVKAEDTDEIVEGIEPNIVDKMRTLENDHAKFKAEVNEEMAPFEEKLAEVETKVIKIEGIGSVAQGTSGITGNNQYFVSSYNGKLYRSKEYNQGSFGTVEVPYIDGMILVYNEKIMLIVKGNRIVFMEDIIAELRNLIEQEVQRATENEKLLSYKVIKLVGWGTISEGTTGVTGDGQYFYSTVQHKIYMSKKYESPTAIGVIEVPYVDGSLYIYNQEIYEWNGENLVKITFKEARIIEDLMEELNRIIGFRFITFKEDSFIKLSGGIGSIVDVNPAQGGTFRCGIIEVTEGEEFIITAKGGAVGRAYGIVNANDTLIEVAAPNEALDNARITMPANAAKLIINDNNSEKYYAFKVNRIDKLEDEIKLLKQEIEELNDSASCFPKERYTQAFIDGMKMVWNANCIASYNTLEALTDKVSGMKCEVMYTEPSEGETQFTSLALISNPNGVHNTKQFWSDLNNKPKTHINIKSIHPVFTRNYCSFGVMHEGELFNIPYNGNTHISYAEMLPGVEYVYGWSIIDNGVEILLPDGSTIILSNGEYVFNSNKGGVSTPITLNISFSDYCGKYCCFEFFNNSPDEESKKRCGQPQITKVQVTQSDGFNIYDNFIRPNGLLGVTPAGFVWHEQAAEGYYGYQSIIS